VTPRGRDNVRRIRLTLASAVAGLVVITGCTAHTASPSPGRSSLSATTIGGGDTGCAAYVAAATVKLGIIDGQTFGNPTQVLATVHIGQVLQVLVFDAGSHSIGLSAVGDTPTSPMRTAPRLVALCETPGASPTGYFRAVLPGTEIVEAEPDECGCDMMPFDAMIQVVP
jgi:hypothetical protein